MRTQHKYLIMYYSGGLVSILLNFDMISLSLSFVVALMLLNFFIKKSKDEEEKHDKL